MTVTPTQIREAMQVDVAKLRRLTDPESYGAPAYARYYYHDLNPKEPTLFEDFKIRLSSRKFLTTGSSLVAFVASKNYALAATVVLAYLGVEGYGDIVSRKES
jgi:hypothetical protein